MGGDRMRSCQGQNKMPTIYMVAGATKILTFSIIDASGRPIDLEGYTARFSLVSASNRSGSSIVTKNMTLKSSTANIFTVLLNAEDTVSLCGKYTYQVWVIGADGLPEEPMQGDLYIERNIDKGFLNKG